MKTKTKLQTGIGSLLLIIILFSAIGIYLIYSIKLDTGNILKDNYQSVQYIEKMLSALESDSQESLQIFERNLKFEENNNTEPGEAEKTAILRAEFNQYRMDSLSIKKREIRKSLYALLDINLNTIEDKSDIAKSTAKTAILWIMASAGISIGITALLFFNLPSNIADPIKKLTASLQQIAAKDYTQRVHFKGNTEFKVLADSFNLMAGKLEEYESSNLGKLMMEKKWRDILINNMNEPVIGMNGKNEILFINETASKIMGLLPGKVIGESIFDLAEKNPFVKSVLGEYSTPYSLTESRVNKIVRLIGADNDIYFEKEIIPIKLTWSRQKTEKYIGKVIKLKDITQYKQLDLAKTKWIANVSHDFKTPLSSINMSLQLIEDKRVGGLNQEQRELVESIKQDTGLLSEIVTQLLAMTKIDSGHIKLSLFPTDPKKIAQYAAKVTLKQAQQKRVKVLINYPGSVPKIRADREKTAWVLINLVSNAIRYSSPNTTVYLSIEEKKEHLQFSVKDTGPGIAKEYQEKIFERYFRAPDSKKGGTGLGLAISKEFMEAQGGQILIKSEYGKGSTFFLRLKKIS